MFISIDKKTLHWQNRDSSQVSEQFFQIKQTTYSENQLSMNPSILSAGVKCMFILVGAPGAGKHTLVSQGFNGHVDYGYIEMGQIMRDEVKGNTHHGKEIKAYQDEGRMVPDDITMAIARREFEANHSHSVLFTDGFPRTIPQVVPAIDLGRQYGFTRFIIIHVHTGDDTCIERIMKARRGRKDDGSRELAVDRLKVFKSETLPIIGHLKGHLDDFEGDFHTISGESMEQDAVNRAHGLCLLYDIPTKKEFKC